MEILVGRKKTKVQIDPEEYSSIVANKYYLCNSQHGYIVLKKYLGFVNSKPKYEEIYLHRYLIKPPKGYQVDHINRNKLDNRKENLRVCSAAENAVNQSQSRGKYKGVYQDKKSHRWLAQITKNYKCYHIGSFETPELAAKAYNKKAKSLHGEFAFINTIQ